MASLLYGKVYYQDFFAGILREEPANLVTFTYDSNYIEAGHPAIAHLLPVRPEPHNNHNGLHPFFDNLLAEGWLQKAQSRRLGTRKPSPFALLLAFGFDCAGAVWVVDPESPSFAGIGLDDDPMEVAALTSRASLSGVQPKLAVVVEGSGFRPAQSQELSTHIAKFAHQNHPNLVENEYLTAVACKTLLPEDDVVELKIDAVAGVDRPALLIKRFDRDGKKRIHFEEFNQLLGRNSQAKYEGSYKDMADFIRQTDGCMLTQAFLLYRRLLLGFLLGNTDMHLKNFAMFHADGSGLMLTPSYDQVAAVLYDYKELALTLAGSPAQPVGRLLPKHIILLGKEFGLPPAAINLAVKGLEKNMEAAKDAVAEASLNSGHSGHLKDDLIQWMDKRWKGTFALVGQKLSQKQ